MFSISDARARLTFLTKQLSGIATSMRQAVARHDNAALEAMRPLYRKLAGEAATLRSQINADDMPGEFMQSLAKFSNDVDEVGRTFTKQLGNVTGGIASAFRSLPLILGAVAVLAVVGAVIYLRRK